MAHRKPNPPMTLYMTHADLHIPAEKWATVQTALMAIFDGPEDDALTFDEWTAEYAPTTEEREMDKARHEYVGEDDWHLEEKAA